MIKIYIDELTNLFVIKDTNIVAFDELGIESLRFEQHFFYKDWEGKWHRIFFEDFRNILPSAIPQILYDIRDEYQDKMYRFSSRGFLINIDSVLTFMNNYFAGKFEYPDGEFYAPAEIST